MMLKEYKEHMYVSSCQISSFLSSVSQSLSPGPENAFGQLSLTEL